MNDYCGKKLNEILELRRKANSSYSLRAMARDLEIDSSNLSAIINGKRGLPPRRAEFIAKKLSLTAFEKSQFINSSYKKKYKLDELNSGERGCHIVDEELHYDLIAKWEYFAIFELLKTKNDNKIDCEWISKRLGISQDKTWNVIKTLEHLGFISTDENNFQLLAESLETTFDVSSEALKTSHKESLELAEEKLNEVEIMMRDFSSLTIAINSNQIPVIKTLIREFQDKIYNLIDQSDMEKNEVYMLGTQFFPLTKNDKEVTK